MKLRENNRLHDISERVEQYNNIKTIKLKPFVIDSDQDKKTE